MTRCAKCQGCLIVNHDDFYCLNCGARPLEVVRQPEPETRENRRGFLTTHCPEGHEYTEETSALYRYAGRHTPVRKCLLCRRAARQANREDA